MMRLCELLIHHAKITVNAERLGECSFTASSFEAKGLCFLTPGLIVTNAGRIVELRCVRRSHFAATCSGELMAAWLAD